MAGKFEIFKDELGQIRFRLVTDSGKILLSSEACKHRSIAEKRIEWIKFNANDDDCIEFQTSYYGYPLFKLRAAGEGVVGTSEPYISVAERQEGLDNFRSFAPTAQIDDLTDDFANATPIYEIAV